MQKLLLWAVASALAVAGAAENFEKLPASSWKKQMEAKKWQTDEVVRMPKTWMPMLHSSNGIYQLTADNPGEGKLSLKLVGNVMMIPDAVKFDPAKHTVLAATFLARGESDTLVNFHLVPYAAKRGYLPTITAQVPVSTAWKKYFVRIAIPKEIKGKPVVSVTPGIGSAGKTPIYLDMVDFQLTDAAGADAIEKAVRQENLKSVAAILLKSVDFEDLPVVSGMLPSQMKAKNWKFDEPLRLPSGWIPMLFRSNCSYHIVTDDPGEGKKSLKLWGDLQLQPGVLAYDPDEHIAVRLTCLAKGESSAARALLHVVLYGDGNSYLTTRNMYIPLTTKWKEYNVSLDIPSTVNGKAVKAVAPAIGTSNGIVFFDAVLFQLVSPQKKTVKAVKPQANPIMDFDFKGVNGKSEVSDKTGSFKVVSECGNFIEENSSLRTSFGSRFRIDFPKEKLNDRFTISTWMVRSSINWGYRAPLIECGYQMGFSDSTTKPHSKYDFSIEFNCFVPEFRTFYGGLLATGHYFGNKYRYVDPKWVKNDPASLVLKDQFFHFSAVYDRGTTRTYVNGIPVAERVQNISEAVLQSGCPFYLGAARVEGESDNQFSADLLIRDFKLYDTALTEAEIGWESEQVPSGIKPRQVVSLKPTRAYESPEMKEADPKFEKRMPITAEWLKKPVEPCTWEKLSVTLTGDTRSIGIAANGKMLPQVAWGPVLANQKIESMRDMAASGAKLYRFSNIVSDRFWLAPDKIDLERWYFKELDKLLAVDPDALILLVIPVSQPSWLFRDYADELEEHLIDSAHPELGKNAYRGFGGPFGSDLWLKFCTDMIGEFIRQMERSKYAKHIISYHVTCGDSAEWYWPGQFSGLTGQSRRTLESFRKYMKEIVCKSDLDMLRKRWDDPSITFETITVPTNAERRKCENGFFRDASGSAQKCIDFRRYVNYRTKLAFDMVCGAARAAAPKDKLITTYFGYSLYYAGRQSILHLSGLQFTAEAMRSAYIDGLMTPIDYLHRRGGEPGINIAGYSGSGPLYRKLLWREEDLRTHFHDRLEWGRTATADETNEVIKRGVGYTLADSYGAWFMALETNHGFHQQKVLEAIAAANAAAVSAQKPVRDIAEVALVFDEKDSVYQLGWLPDSFGRFIVNHIWGVYSAAHSSGVPFKVHLLEDLADSRMHDYKLYIFLNAYSISPEQRKIIQAKLAKNNAYSLWQYAPGYLNDGKFNLAGMKELTSFEFNESRDGTRVGGYRITPLLTVKPTPGVKIEKSENKVPLFASRDRNLWSLLPLADTDIAALAQRAGIHRYAEAGDLLIANEKYIMLHTYTDGAKAVTLPQAAGLRDMLTGKRYPAAIRHELGKIAKGKTILLEIQ